MYGKEKEFWDWLDSISRPKASELLKAVDKVVDMPRKQLMKCGNLFKFLPGTEPKLFEIRRDQARLFCYQLASGDLAVVHWILKKDNRIPKNELKTAERRTKEMLGND